MRKNRILLYGLIGFFLAIGIGLTGCSNGVSGPGKKTGAQTPVISSQPTSRDYFVGRPVRPLTVEASVTDGGTLTYQWYNKDSFEGISGTAIVGETTSSYTPTITEEGTQYFYVVITNMNDNAPGAKTASVTSGTAQIGASNNTVPTLPQVITVDTSTKYQYIRGLGGASAVMFRAGTGGASPDIDVNDIDLMFNPDGAIRANFLRINLHDDMDGLLANQIVGGNGVVQDNSDYWDIIKKVNGYGGYVWACPWTAPATFKTNNSLVGGGHLKPELYDSYAEYLKAFLRRANAAGAPIWGISIQNEPNFSAAYEGMDWSNQELHDWHKQEGRFTNGIPGFGGGQATASVKIMSGESANTPTIYDTTLNDPLTRPNVDFILRHYYGNQQYRYANALDHATDPKEVWQTEYNDSTGDSAANHPLRSTWDWIWFVTNDIDISQRLNDESVFVWWYSKRFYGFVGDGQFGTTNRAVLPRGYAMGQFARYSLNTKRVKVTTSGIANINPATSSNWDTNAKVTAYESLDGNTISMVITTPTNKGTGGVDLGEVQINLPWEPESAQAIETVVSGNTSAEPQANKLVVLRADGSATVTVSRGSIVSIQFRK